MKKSVWIIFLVSILLVGCSNSHDIATRIKNSNDIATQSNFQLQQVKGGDFILTTYQRITDRNKPYVFYIEGDGYISEKYKDISDNPTPVNPMLIKLATIDKRPNIVYIARPCQYTPLESNPKCTNDYWKDKRMNKEIVNSINEVINYINDGQKFSLIGFSGGGGLAILITNKNNNVKDIITIAGNLDIITFDHIHKGRGHLSHSLNPLYYSRQINNIPQLHLSGANDRKIPPSIGGLYVKASSSSCVKQKIFPAVSHLEGWDKVWASVLDIPLTCY